MEEFLLSKHYFDTATTMIPGGVNSPVRACKSVGTLPLFIEKASGCYIHDVDGNSYIDYVGSWGPMILGHNNHEVKGAIQNALENGTSFGAPTWKEVELANKIIEMIPSIEMVRLVNSGTEATMSAIRLARAFTGRDKIVKFNGCYHGHADSFLVKAGSGVATLGIPGSPGVPTATAEHTISIPFNDFNALEEVLTKEAGNIAAVIVEPVPANMGVVPPHEDFLPTLRQWTSEREILLIFDEVITGFRLAPGGAQEYFDVMPDLTCLGKIIGGGLPVGAYGGREDIMKNIAPEGQVYQAGTLSGNPLATAAGLATLNILSRPGIYEVLEEKAQIMADVLSELATSNGIPCMVQRAGSMMTCFFGQKKPVINFEAAIKSDTTMYAQFYKEMLLSGIYLAPSQFEAAFVSLAHGWGELDATFEAAEEIFRKLGGE